MLLFLSELEQKGLQAVPPADKRTLIRRATFDLHGLPPTPEEVDNFVNDSSADAYRKLIDRLLDSPRYGERWGTQLAGCGSLCRHGRIRNRPLLSQRLAIPGLCDRVF